MYKDRKPGLRGTPILARPRTTCPLPEIPASDPSSKFILFLVIDIKRLENNYDVSYRKICLSESALEQQFSAECK